ncbi:Centromere protein T [Pristimantis euphronides]
MNLRSKMKERVRRSLGKSTLETSGLKRNVPTSSKTKPKSVKRGSYPTVEELDDMTPRTLLRKIIQTENEVSMIVSQRPKAAAGGDQAQGNNSTVNVNKVNLSLPDVEEEEPITVFRASRKKRKMRVSEFEREVDERLHKNKGMKPFISSPLSAMQMNDGIVLHSATYWDHSHPYQYPTFKKALNYDKGYEPSQNIHVYAAVLGLLHMLGHMGMVAAIQNKYIYRELLYSIITVHSKFRASVSHAPNYSCFYLPLRLYSHGQRCFISETWTEFEWGSTRTPVHQTVLMKGSTSVKRLVPMTVQTLNASYFNSFRSVENKLDISAVPELVLRKALLRRPQKVYAVSLDDFEKGVEEKYQLLKGSQEGLISEEDKSNFSLNDLAEKNTALYERSLRKDASASKSDRTHRRASKLLASPSDALHNTNNQLLEPETGTPSPNVNAILHAQSPGGNANKDYGEDRGEVGDEEEAGRDDEGDGDGVDADAVDDDESDAVVDDHDEADVVVDDVDEDNDEADVVVEDNDEADVDEDDTDANAGDDLRDLESNMQQNKSTPTSSHRKSTGVNEYSPSTQHTRLSNKHSMRREESINLHTKSVSRLEESSESSQSSDDDNLDLAKSPTGRGMARKKENNQLMLSALPDTPAYMKLARFANTDKPAISKKVQKPTTKSTKPKKEKSVFSKSHLKHIFTHRIKMKVAKDAMEDVEKSLSLYLNRLAIDLSTYAAHANRKTITRADMELLMRRQRLVNDTTSLNVLIEKHLPWDCRTLLIPCATSGNQVLLKM